MSEKRRPVQPVRVSYACDQCGGDVLPTGMCLTSYPAQYPHDCQQCGERYTFTSLYPRIEYVDAVAVANDMARKTLELPTDCADAVPTFSPAERHVEFVYSPIGLGAPTNTQIDVSGDLRPPTFEQRHAANDEALQEIHEMVWGDAK